MGQVEGGKLVVDMWQVLWGINTLVLAIVTFLYNRQREDHKELKGQLNDLADALDERMPKDTCERIHRELKDKFKEISEDQHVHGSYGQAGEVIKK